MASNKNAKKQQNPPLKLKKFTLRFNGRVLVQGDYDESVTKDWLGQYFAENQTNHLRDLGIIRPDEDPSGVYTGDDRPVCERVDRVSSLGARFVSENLEPAFLGAYSTLLSLALSVAVPTLEAELAQVDGRWKWTADRRRRLLPSMPDLIAAATQLMSNALKPG